MWNGILCYRFNLCGGSCMQYFCCKHLGGMYRVLFLVGRRCPILAWVGGGVCGRRPLSSFADLSERLWVKTQAVFHHLQRSTGQSPGLYRACLGRLNGCQRFVDPCCESVWVCRKPCLGQQLPTERTVTEGVTDSIRFPIGIQSYLLREHGDWRLLMQAPGGPSRTF